MKGFIKRGFACISAMAILFTCVEVPTSTQAMETDSVDSTETSERDYSLEGVDLWGTEIIQSSIDNKIEDIMIEDFKAEDYDEFYASLVELIRYYLVSWQNDYVYFTLLMTPEEHEKLTGLGDDIKSTEGMNYWTQIIGNARVAATDSIEEMDEAYWNYFDPHTSYTVSSSWMSTSSSNNEYASQGYIKIKVGFKAYRGSSAAEELEARQTVIQMFSEGGALSGYGKDNDLKTDFEKATAVWYWIRDNVVYSGGTDRSSYAAIVKKRAVCGSYSTGSVLLLHYAGVDARYIDGRVGYGTGTVGHAWNWVKIGEEWYAWDSTWKVYLLGIKTTRYESDYTTASKYENIVSPLSTAIYNYKYNYSTKIYTQNEATDSGSIGSNLKWTLQDGVLKISGTGEMRDFDSADEVPWKNFLNDITTLEIGEGVTSIGANAFANVTGLTYANCKDSLTNITKIGANAFSDQSEEVVNLTAQKSEASSKIDAMGYLEDEEKTSYKEQISKATTEEEINKVVTEAQEKNAKLQEKAELETAKNEAKETLNSCMYLSEEGKASYKTEIEAATTKEEVNEIVAKAQEEDTALQTATELETTKNEAKETLNSYTYLSEENRRKYEAEIEEATDESTISAVVEKAKKENEELKAEADSLTQKKAEGKSAIEQLTYLSTEVKQTYATKIEEASTIEEIDTIIKEAEAENDKLKAEEELSKVTATGYSGTYDGKSHTITLSNVPTGSTIQYRTSTTGSWTTTEPTRTSVGTTTVYYQVTDTAGNTVTGSATITINRASASISATGYSGTYDGKSHTITLSNVPTGSTIQYRTSTTGSWTTTKPTRTSAGTTTVYYQITNENYETVTGSTTIKVNKAKASATAKAYSGTYDGKSHTITLSNVPSGSTIKYRTSTTGSWTTTKPTRTSAGTTTVYYQITNENYETVTGSTTIKVNKAKASATAKAYSGTYDGKSHTITLSNVPSGSTIKYRTSTTGSWTTTKPTRTSAGTTTVYYQITNANYETITGSAKITVNKKNTSKLTVSSISNQTYTGKQIKPSVTVKNGSTKLKSGTDYTVSYGTNKNTGQGYVKITGKGNYTGTVTKYFNIVPKAPSVSLKAGSKSFTVTSKSTGASGYEIAYSTKKNSGYKTVTGSSSKKISGLKAKTTYYVKVRAYKTINGKKVYGSYSSVKTIKTK